MEKSPYLTQHEELVHRCNVLYPYGLKWLDSKSNHVLLALLKKKKEGNKNDIKICRISTKKKSI